MHNITGITAYEACECSASGWIRMEQDENRLDVMCLTVKCRFDFEVLHVFPQPIPAQRRPLQLRRVGRTQRRTNRNAPRTERTPRRKDPLLICSGQTSLRRSPQALQGVTRQGQRVVRTTRGPRLPPITARRARAMPAPPRGRRLTPSTVRSRSCCLEWCSR